MNYNSSIFNSQEMMGARSLFNACGKYKKDKPIIAVVNSYTSFVAGHVHLQEIGKIVVKQLEKLGVVAKEFNTIAICDGIAMGHEGMLYSLPSREIIANSVEYMCKAHQVDGMICISNCDKITPGMLMASMRLNIPTVFVSGGPMEAGSVNNQSADLVDAMVVSGKENATENELKNGSVLWPVRTALSGKQMTPCGATELLEVLGKEESLSRIDKAIDKLSVELG